MGIFAQKSSRACPKNREIFAQEITIAASEIWKREFIHKFPQGFTPNVRAKK